MRLFEQFDAPDLVIFVANTAISIANPDDPNIVRFHLLFFITNN